MNEGAIVSQLLAMQSLADVSGEAVQWLASHVVEVEIGAGSEFITQGATARDCYFIVSGDAMVTRNGAQLGTTGPGEPEGELGLFLGIPRTATTTAITDVRALRLDASDFDDLRDSNGELADSLRVGICRHLARRFGLPSFAGVSATAHRSEQ